MTKNRKMTITVEVETVLTKKELGSLQALVFGCLKQTKKAKARRSTIKHRYPSRPYHDVRGTITNVTIEG